MKFGSASIPIYLSESKGRKRYFIAHYRDGKRIRKTFLDLAELNRLSWSAFDLDRGIIELRAGQARTASRRIIPISDNLRAWIAPPTLTLHNQSLATGLIVWGRLSANWKHLPGQNWLAGVKSHAKEEKAG